jgi:hypothetical protein
VAHRQQPRPPSGWPGGSFDGFQVVVELLQERVVASVFAQLLAGGGGAGADEVGGKASNADDASADAVQG